MKKTLTLSLLLLLVVSAGFSQHNHSHNFTKQDTLRGSITVERAWWDLQHYELSISVDPKTKSIKGNNIIRYTVLENSKVMQIDLQPPLIIESVTQNGEALAVRTDGNAHFIQLTEEQKKGKTHEINVAYSGKPQVAKNAPWDGGFTWDKDEKGNDFIATSCQGLGASIWWPCKDHMYDEPDSGMLIHATVPKHLTAVSNGRLIGTKKGKNKSKTYSWKVVNPINNYGVNLNIGDYVHFGDKYAGEKGPLDMDYWVLSYNLDKAKVQFKDAVRTMEALEHWFGPYPFYEDSYKLVEVPYLGMEHQSSVTYGNGYQNGYAGFDRSMTGWGDKFDFIIVHESGHEWFANNITYKDMADMWIHESFTTYSEGLFVEYFYGKEAGAEYIRGKRMGIQNNNPMITHYDVNEGGDGDIYPKGCNMLHTLRQVVNDDEKWLKMLRGINEEFYHQTVTTKQIEDYISKQLGLDLKAFFDQYLRDVRVPTLEYRIVKGNHLMYRWKNCNRNFDMPIRATINGKETTLQFNKKRRVNSIKLDTDNPTIKLDPNYYIYSINTMGEYSK